MPLRTLLLSTLEDRGVQRLYEAEPSIDTSVYGSKVVNIVRSIAAAIHPVTPVGGRCTGGFIPSKCGGRCAGQLRKKRESDT